MTYGTLISTQTIGAGGAASIDFTSIPQTYTDLIVVVSSKPATGSVGYMLMSLNGSSANFSGRLLEGNGASASSLSYTVGRVGDVTDSTSAGWGSAQIYIPNYAGSTNKAISAEGVSEANASTAYQDLFATLWSNTAAITSLSLSSATGANWAQYTTASLYGIK